MRFVSKAQLMQMVPYSFTHIARLEAAGLFPKRIKPTGFARKNTDYCKVFYVEQEVLDWMQKLVDARDQPTDTPKGDVTLIASNIS